MFDCGYVPGKSYTLKIDASHSGSQRIGFEITAENNPSGKIGTFAVINDKLTQFSNDSNAVTHNSKGTIATNDSISWQLNWEAPGSGSGDVTFYLAVNATNGDLSSSR
ncbi:MAG: Reeler domain-containing protein [Bacteroidota bacterium]